MKIPLYVIIILCVLFISLIDFFNQDDKNEYSIIDDTVAKTKQNIKYKSQINDTLYIYDNNKYYKFIVYNKFYKKNKLIYYLNYLNLNNKFDNDYAPIDSSYINDDDYHLFYMQRKQVNNTNIYYIKSESNYKYIRINNTISFYSINYTSNVLKYYINDDFYIIKINNISQVLFITNNI